MRINYFWLRWLLTAARGLSAVAVVGGYSLVAVSFQWGVLPCCGAPALGNRLSVCSTWDPPRPGVKPVSPRLDLNG